MTTINQMTSSEITASIRELEELARTGRITLGQADRLGELREARRRIERAARPTPWWR
jgi:ribosomal protein L29